MGDAELQEKGSLQAQRSFWSMGHLLFFRTCRHSGVTVGTLDLDRALERTSIMQRVTYEKAQERVKKLMSPEDNSVRSSYHRRLEHVPGTDAGSSGQGHTLTGS